MSNLTNQIADRMQASSFGTSQQVRRIVLIPIEEIDLDPNQPRKRFDEGSLKELAASIERQGLLQPILVRRNPDTDRYVITAGERRFRAHQLLGRSTIEAIISTGNHREAALVENMQRENLAPLEEAEGLQVLMQEHGYTHEEVARVVGKSRPTVTNLLRINDLPEQIKAACRAGEASPSQELLKELVTADPARQMEIWEAYRDGRLQTTRDVRVAKGRKKKPTAITVFERAARTIAGAAKAIERAGGGVPTEDERSAIRKAVRALNAALKEGPGA